MEPRTHVIFESDFDASGNPDFPAGHDLAECIHQAIAERGVSVTDLDLQENYGWCFDAISGGVPVWCLVQSYEPWLLVVQVDYPFIHWLRRRKPSAEQERVRQIVHDILSGSPRFSDVRWFTHREFNRYNQNA